MFKRFRNTSPSPAREADESYEFLDPPSPPPARAATTSPSDSASQTSPLGMGIQPSSSGLGSNQQGMREEVPGGRELMSTPDCPAWLPHRPPLPAPPSTVASVRGATPTFPFQRSGSGMGSAAARPFVDTREMWVELDVLRGGTAMGMVVGTHRQPRYRISRRRLGHAT